MQIVLRDNSEIDFPLGGNGRLITFECFDHDTGITELLCRAQGNEAVLNWANVICQTVYGVELEERHNLYDPHTCQSRNFFVAPLEKLQNAYNWLTAQGLDVLHVAEDVFCCAQCCCTANK